MTALNELINKWEEQVLKGFIPKNAICLSFIDDAKYFLEKEKQKISHAYEMGVAEQKAGIALKSGNEFYEMNYE